MAELAYAFVKGRFAVVRGDTTGDPDVDPDTVYCDQGTVTFTPVAATFRAAAADPDPLTIIASPVVAQIGTDGRLELNGSDGVWLLDLGSDQLNPPISRTAAAYTVSFAGVRAAGQSVTIPAFGFHPVPDEDNDLTLLAPLAVVASVPITRGLKGDKGDKGDTGDVGPEGPVSEAELATVAAGVAGKVSKSALLVDVKEDYGTNTAAIEAAWDDAKASGRGLFFGDATFTYNGAGLSGSSHFVMVGMQSYLSKIVLGAGSRLIDTPALVASLRITGITFEGGAGAFRSTYAGSNVVNRNMVVEDNDFSLYTAAAIEAASSDWPWWKIRRNTFSGVNDTSTMGIALPGLADQNAIRDNAFLRNRVHVKLADGGNNASLSGNSFLRLSAYAGTPRIDVWVVPKAGSAVNAGAGLTITPDNKFGPENLDAADLRVVYADELAGASFGTRWPNLAADSAGFIVGHNIAGAFYGAVPPVYSTTPRLIGNKWGPFLLSTATKIDLVKLRTTPRTLDGSWSRSWKDNTIGPAYGISSPSIVGLSASNEVGLGHVVDPTGAIAAGTPWAPQQGAPPNKSDYRNLLTTLVRAFTTGGGGSVANVADAYGGTEAVEYTTTGTGSQLYAVAAVAAPGDGNCWLSVDVAPGSSSPLASLEVRLQDFSSNKHRTWVLTPRTSGWATFLLGPHNFESPIGGSNWLLLFAGPGAGKVQIGRIRMYQSRNPVTFPPDVTATLDFPSVPAGSQAELTVAFTGARVGDPVRVIPPTTLNAGLVATAYVSANDTVTVRVLNVTTAAIDPASSSWKVSL